VLRKEKSAAGDDEGDMVKGETALQFYIASYRSLGRTTSQLKILENKLSLIYSYC